MPSATQAAILYARGLEEQGQVAEAATVYEQLLAEHSDNSVALHRLAVINSQLGNFDKADKYFREVMSLDHDNPEILSDFGYNCFLQNKLIDAEKSYLAALNLKSNSQRLHNNLAVLYARTNRADHAVEQFRAAGCDPVTARKNLLSAMHEFDLPVVSPALPFDTRPTPTSDSQRSGESTSVPVINFSAPPLQHMGNPAASIEQHDSVSSAASHVAEVAQAAFWEPVKQPPRSTIAQQDPPSGLTSSRRKLVP
jgi:hypothetical protein